jgi:hypothetical protein
VTGWAEEPWLATQPTTLSYLSRAAGEESRRRACEQTAKIFVADRVAADGVHSTAL